MLAVSIPVEEHSLPRSIHNRFTGKQFLGRKDDRFPGPEAATTSLPRTQGRRNGIENGENSRLSFPKILYSRRYTTQTNYIRSIITYRETILIRYPSYDILLKRSSPLLHSYETRKKLLFSHLRKANQWLITGSEGL